jgi:tRNA (cytidine/uridine-2'-O-)-methyltransferase
MTTGKTTARPSLHVALVAPEIAWNAGNAGRTCLAAGAALHLVRPLGFHLGPRWIRRAGLDYWDRVALTVHDDLAAFERALPALGEPLFFSAEAARTLWETPIAERAVLVFGGESAGLSAPLRERHAPRLVRLPMRDATVRSLNVSTCVGIAVYEALRRRAT